MRNQNIDSVKGVLLVVVGHILKGSLDENLARYIIYSFHMPLFIALAGYLFNSHKFSGSNTGFQKLFDYYKARLIIPWMFATLLYFIFFNVDYSKPIKSFAYNLVIQYYHLWFVS